MKRNTFNLAKLSRKREKYLNDVASKYDEKLSKDIRAHFVDLFREAYKVDPGLVAVLTGMGSVCVSGVVKYTYNKGDEDESTELVSLNKIFNVDDSIFHPETRKLLAEVEIYSELVFGNGNANLPDFDDITADEIEGKYRKVEIST